MISIFSNGHGYTCLDPNNENRDVSFFDYVSKYSRILNTFFEYWRESYSKIVNIEISLK